MAKDDLNYYGLSRSGVDRDVVTLLSKDYGRGGRKIVVSRSQRNFIKGTRVTTNERVIIRDYGKIGKSGFCCPDIIRIREIVRVDAIGRI